MSYYSHIAICCFVSNMHLECLFFVLIMGQTENLNFDIHLCRSFCFTAALSVFILVHFSIQIVLNAMQHNDD